MKTKNKKLLEKLDFIRDDLCELEIFNDNILENEIPLDNYFIDNDSFDIDTVKNVILIKRKIDSIREMIHLIELNDLD